jgi:hypothetical protein
MTANAPVIIYCLDNFSFGCANIDGYLSPISKLDDSWFYVADEIVVVLEVTMAAAVINLKRIQKVCVDRQVYVITPAPGISTCRAAASPTTARTY